jgi:hypothetical protein
LLTSERNVAGEVLLKFEAEPRRSESSNLSSGGINCSSMSRYEDSEGNRQRMKERHAKGLQETRARAHTEESYDAFPVDDQDLLGFSDIAQLRTDLTEEEIRINR